MTSTSVPQFVKTIDPLRGLTLADGRRLSLRWAADLRQFGEDALPMLQLTIDEAQQLLASEREISTAMDAQRPASMSVEMPKATWRHSRYAPRSAARKTPHTCGHCRRLRRPCWLHAGGKAGAQ